MSPEILNPILLLGILGLVFGLGLSLAARVFAVEVDPRVEALEETLPGANCGGCGYPGCSGYAEAIASGAAAPNLCTAASAEVIARIGEIMGVTIEAKERMIAVVRCRGDVSTDNRKYDYLGDSSCAEAVLVAEGPNPCVYGCVGMGTCVHACPFDAIHIRPGRPPAVDPDKCTACGNCVVACPKNLIDLVPASRKTIVLCCNHDKGKSAKDSCAIACIGCGKCSKNCPEQCITMDNNLPHIDYEKCTACGTCAAVCPQKTIFFDGVLPEVPKGKGKSPKTEPAG